MYKSYKYYIKPNKEQRNKINEFFNGSIKIHNMYVEDVINNRNIPKLSKDIYDKYIKKDSSLLKYNKSILINELFRVSDKKEYKRYRSYTRYPKSYICPILPKQKEKLYIKGKYINIPYIGEVKFAYSRELPKNGEIINITITENENNKYYIIILFKIFYEKEVLLNLNNSIGLDYSSTFFAVDNNGGKYSMPHFYRDKESLLEKKQAELTRCRKNSNNYYKKRIELYNINNNLANKRKDYLHKLSTNLANKYDYIFVEDINLEDISQNYNLGKATYDNSYGMFLSMLEYKMNERNKVIKKINKWFPSTKQCSICGYINKELKLSDRNWKCPNCNSYHDRDINAATNIRNEGIKLITNSLGGRTV